MEPARIKPTRITLVAYERTFGWFGFPQGAIRYAGGARGRDERPIEVFDVRIDGSIYHGEIKRNFLPHGDRYELRIVSFGWIKNEWCGTALDPDLCASFTRSQLEDIQALICQAIATWDGLEDKPSFLFSTRSQFNGDVVFQEGWALLKDEKGAQ